MTVTRIKICGIRTVKDALAATEAGANAIGLNFWQPGKRYIDPQQASAIVQALPPFITVVGVFVDETVEHIRAIVQQVRLHAVQLHDATEPDRYTEATLSSDFGAPLIPVIRPSDRNDLDRQFQLIERAGLSGKTVLLDTPSSNLPGGTGQVFDWNLALAAQQRCPIILAGGLTPENVAAAVKAVHPYAVDVASGVESSPGVKDTNKMSEFVETIRTV